MYMSCSISWKRLFITIQYFIIIKMNKNFNSKFQLTDNSQCDSSPCLYGGTCLSIGQFNYR